MTNDDYDRELDNVDRKLLIQAAGPLNKWSDAGEDRYCFYRRKGHAPDDALAYALAWCRNSVEQAARRKSHETGCPA